MLPGLAGQALVERDPEIVEPPKRYTLSYPPQSVNVKVQVMQRVKGGRVDLTGEKKVPQVGT
jgi:hypothetical protein